MNRQIGRHACHPTINVAVQPVRDEGDACPRPRRAPEPQPGQQSRNCERAPMGKEDVHVPDLFYQP